ncbi:MerR family transcriptional regulator [Magnetovirga frankeli]|uniref:MerR family transcriptional regulator n=1 Tax=Magnetovirga frankeli TaxID=947516 RepID=UPI00129326DE|nr:MerR family transcriptional regulator [gamma proteobacterium SS-5]
MDHFPIRIIAELSGVPATTLRAWERRYGLLQPGRAPSGHRLYTPADLERVKRVVRLLDAGLPIREAAKQVKQGRDGALPSHPREHWQVLRRRLLNCLGGFDQQKLDGLYNEALSLYPFDLVCEQLITPLLQALAERWPQRPAAIAEEHFFSAYLRNKLGSRLHHEAPRSRGRPLLLACVPAERHEIGLLMFALALLGRGYRVIYLGPDLPLEQIGPVVERTGAVAVVLSATTRMPDLSALSELIDRLGIPLCLGGAQAEAQAEPIRACGAYPIGGQIPLALSLIEQLAPAHG